MKRGTQTTIRTLWYAPCMGPVHYAVSCPPWNLTWIIDNECNVQLHARVDRNWDKKLCRARPETLVPEMSWRVDQCVTKAGAVVDGLGLFDNLTMGKTEVLPLLPTSLLHKLLSYAICWTMVHFFVLSDKWKTVYKPKHRYLAPLCVVYAQLLLIKSPLPVKVSRPTLNNDFLSSRQAI